MQSEALKQASQAVHQRCNPYRKLRSHASRLFCDLLGLAACLRPAVMVDYMVIDPELLAVIVGDVVTALGCEKRCSKAVNHLAKPPADWLVAVLEGCCYVVRPGILRNSYCQKTGSHPFQPLLISFSSDSNPSQGSTGAYCGMSPIWTCATESSALVEQICLLAEKLLSLTAHGSSLSHDDDHRLAQHSNGAVPHSKKSSVGNSQGMQVSVVDLASVSDMAGLSLPPMPTLSGLLLGLPVVYVVEGRNHAEAASRCLSCSSLCFYSVFLQWGLEGIQVAEPLLGFSVPLNLVEDTPWERLRQSWLVQLKKLAETATSNGFPWVGLVLDSYQSLPRPIAL